MNNDRRGSDFNRSTTLTLEPSPCAGGQCATLVFAGQSEKEDEVHATAASLLRVNSATWYSVMPPHRATLCRHPLQRYAAVDLIEGRS